MDATNQERFELEFLADSGNNVNQGQTLNTAFRSISLNPNITKRKAYGYIWTEIATNNTWCFLECRISFFFKSARVFTLPFRYFAALPNTSPPYTGGDKSIAVSLIEGGIVQRDCELFIPRNPLTALVLNPEGTDPVVLQPRYLDFVADRFDIDINPDAANGGFDLTNFRFFFILTSQ